MLREIASLFGVADPFAAYDQTKKERDDHAAHLERMEQYIGQVRDALDRFPEENAEALQERGITYKRAVSRFSYQRGENTPAASVWLTHTGAHIEYGPGYSGGTNPDLPWAKAMRRYTPEEAARHLMTEALQMLA